MKRLIISAISVLFLEAMSASAISAQTTGVNSTGNLLNYPSGTRVYRGGEINTPNGRVISPTLTTRDGKGSTTYYYPDGTSITTNPNTLSPSGTFLTPGSLNGGLRTPSSLNDGLRNLRSW
jgi:hypothetical protein